MRSYTSLPLTLLALWASFAYGFSVGTASGQAHRLGTTTKLSFQTGSPPSTTMQKNHPVFLPRGGARITSLKESSNSGPLNTGSKCPVTGALSVFGSVWGTGGVLYILAKAIKRVLPIALEPFQKGSTPLSQLELVAYAVTCVWFAYVEGYKGFQKKFSPLVVARSFTLVPGKNGSQWYHFFLAPLYSMGLMHATRKRQITSWSVSTGIVLVVAAVKRLPYPWRNIIDAGVVAGLTWGSLSIAVLYLRAWLTGKLPSVDAALPEGKND